LFVEIWAFATKLASNVLEAAAVRRASHDVCGSKWKPPSSSNQHNAPSALATDWIVAHAVPDCGAIA
jgi:hypothetical protein